MKRRRNKQGKLTKSEKKKIRKIEDKGKKKRGGETPPGCNDLFENIREMQVFSY
jgi:hypothetical protein